MSTLNNENPLKSAVRVKDEHGNEYRLLPAKKITFSRIVSTYTALITTVLGFLILGTLGNNHQQAKEIEQQAAKADYISCVSGNVIREQNNLRTPLERYEARSALLLASLIEYLDSNGTKLPTFGIRLNSDNIREKLNEIKDIELRDCSSILDEYSNEP